MRRSANVVWLLAYLGLAAIALGKLFYLTSAEYWLSELGYFCVKSGAVLLCLRACLVWWQSRGADVRVSESNGRLEVQDANGKSEYAETDTHVLRDRKRLWLFRPGESIWTLEGLTQEECDQVETLLPSQTAIRLERSERWTTSLVAALVLLALVFVGFLVGGGVARRDVQLHGLILLGASLLGAVVLRRLRGRRLVVGVDGLAVGNEFVPFRETTALLLGAQRLTVVSAGRPTQQWRVDMGADLSLALSKRLRGVVGSLNGKFADDVAGAAARAEAKQTSEDVAELERGEGEDVQDWLDRLRGSIAGGDFRTPALPTDTVQAILQSAHTPNLLRAGIAAILAPNEPELIKELTPRLASAEGKRLMNAALLGEAEFLKALA